MSTTPEPTKPDEAVKLYIDAAVSSSDRARAVLIVMITAAVLAFTTIWNAGGLWSEGEGWIDARINLRKAALKFFRPGFDPRAASLSGEEKEMYEKAQQYLEAEGLTPGDSRDEKVLQDDVSHLLKVKNEQIRIIHAPFFGVAFDTNDVGIFAGLTFTVALLWLRFSLARERRNLTLAFEEAEGKGREQQKLCYNLLAMHQVLTLPPIKGQRHRRFWISVALFLYVIPALVYIYEYWSDVKTRQVGYILNSYNMKILLVAGGVFLALIVILTAVCLRHYIMIDRLWRDASRKLSS